MTVREHRPVQDIAAPQARHHGSEPCCRIGPPANLGAGGGAEQAQPEDGAPVRVDAPGRGKHGSFGFKTDYPETSHGTALGPGLG